MCPYDPYTGEKIEEPVNPQPEIPQPVMPQQEIPQPEIPQPTMPQPEMRQPDMSQPLIPQPEKKKRRIWPLILVLVLAAAAAAGGFFVYSHFAKLNRNYASATALFEQGDYEEAAEAFGELGNYKDSASMQERANLWAAAKSAEAAAGTDADAWERAAAAYEAIGEEGTAEAAANCRDMATYYTAEARMASDPDDPDELIAIAGIYEKCNGVMDADEAALDCRAKATYYTAYAMMEDGIDDEKALAEAKTLFEECAGRMDVEEEITNCENGIQYLDALALMEESKWKEAQDIFAALHGSGGFRAAGAYSAECGSHITFEEANKLFDEKKFYDAYTRYRSISGSGYDWMGDIQSKIDACVQPLPSNGEVYHNDKYASQQAQLTVDNSGFMNTFIKIYSGDDLVSSLFIKEDESATIWLPAGTFRMNQAYGENWFGTTDLFGDEGYYWTCSFEGSETFTLESGYGYSISSGGDGTNISNSATDRESM